MPTSRVSTPCSASACSSTRPCAPDTARVSTSWLPRPFEQRQRRQLPRRGARAPGPRSMASCSPGPAARQGVDGHVRPRATGSTCRLRSSRRSAIRVGASGRPVAQVGRLRRRRRRVDRRARTAGPGRRIAPVRPAGRHARRPVGARHPHGCPGEHDQTDQADGDQHERGTRPRRWRSRAARRRPADGRRPLARAAAAPASIGGLCRGRGGAGRGDQRPAARTTRRASRAGDASRRARSAVVSRTDTVGQRDADEPMRPTGMPRPATTPSATATMPTKSSADAERTGEAAT